MLSYISRLVPLTSRIGRGQHGRDEDRVRSRLISFGVAALIACIATAIEAYKHLRLETYPLSVASLLVPVVINLSVAWALVGWYIAALEHPAADFRANLRSAVQAFILLASWATILLGFPLVLALVGYTVPDWSIRLLDTVAWPAVVALAVVLLHEVVQVPISAITQTRISPKLLVTKTSNAPAVTGYALTSA